MKLIVMNRNDKIIVTSEEDFNKEFNEQYKINGEGLSKEDFYYDFCPCEVLNGNINYLKANNCIQFDYSGWQTAQAYNHIETCVGWLEEGKGTAGFNKYTMFHVLMALNSCRVIGKREYEALHKKYCTYEWAEED